MSNLGQHSPPTPARFPGTVPAGSYRDEATIEVEALAAALGHHDAGAEGPVRVCRQREEQHVQACGDGQAEQVAAVVVPVGGGQRAGPAPGRPGGGGRQPVRSAAREGRCSEGRARRAADGGGGFRRGCGGQHPRGNLETPPPL